MATLYVTEFSCITTDHIQAAQEPELASQTVAISGASAASGAFSDTTRLVRVHTDSICSIKFGTSPTATTSNRRMAANQTEYFGVPMGQQFKVAVIANV